MDKEKAIMEVLYSKYGSILEKYGYKPNKAKNKYTLKFLRPTFIITDWKDIFTLYGYDYREMTGWFSSIETIEHLEEKTKNTFPQALEIIIDLDEKFKTLDGILDVLWKKNSLNEYMDVYDAINILVINKLKSEENLLESYQNIISCSQYKSLPENTLQEITKYFNTLKKSNSLY